MSELTQDLWFAARKFRRSPGLVLAAIVTLALGIGANTAIFSLVDGIWLRPLPIADPSHLVAIESVEKRANRDADRETASSYAEYAELRNRVPAFRSVAATSNRGVALKSADGMQMLTARVVSDNFFAVIGAQAELGRLPTEEELSTTQTSMIVLGHRTWTDTFSGDRSVIGRTVNVNGGQATVAGVLPAGFQGLDRVMQPQVFVQQTSWLRWNPSERNLARTVREFHLYARLAPGATLEQARLQLTAAGDPLAREYPQPNAGRVFTAEWNTVDKRFKLLSMLLLVLAGAVLLIACANIANLFLALNDSRRREIAMRISLGATRWRLLRQLVTEYSALAAIGVAVALFLAHRLVAIVPSLMPDLGFPLGFDFRMDHRVLLFTTCIALLSVFLCGVVPGVAATNVSPLDAMRVQGASSGKLKISARKIFVIAQVTASMALLIAAGLLVRTLSRLQAMDSGFDRTQKAALLTIEVDQQDLSDWRPWRLSRTG